MAIFHFRISIVQRSAGRSVVAAAAWHRGIDLKDERLGRTHKFQSRGAGFWSATLLPVHVDEEWRDPERLWNAIEAREKRKDSQLARMIQVALPYELSAEQNVHLVSTYLQQTFVEAGMVADATIRLSDAQGEAKPFATVLTTTRTAAAIENQLVFGNKVREWSDRKMLLRWRAGWAEAVNSGLASVGSPERVDHRSFAERGIDIEPQIAVGVIATRRHERGLPSDRVAENQAILSRRGQ